MHVCEGVEKRKFWLAVLFSNDWFAHILHPSSSSWRTNIVYWRGAGSLKKCPGCLEQRFKTAASLALHRKTCSGIPTPAALRPSKRRIVEVEDDPDLPSAIESDDHVDHVGGSGDWNPQLRRGPLLHLEHSGDDEEEPGDRDMNDDTIGSVIYVAGFSDHEDVDDEEGPRSADGDPPSSSDSDSDVEAHHGQEQEQEHDSDAGSDIEEENDLDAEQAEPSTAFSVETNLPMNLCEFTYPFFFLAPPPLTCHATTNAH